jgi:hypothetical protein
MMPLRCERQRGTLLLLCLLKMEALLRYGCSAPQAFVNARRGKFSWSTTRRPGRGKATLRENHPKILV